MNLKKNALFFSAGLGAILALGTPAFAQDTQPAPAPESETQAAAPADSEEAIVVTGSRIRRNEYTAPAPITVITSERSTLAGLVDTAEILQTSPVAAGQQVNNAFSAFLTDGGPGTNTISLRGLGAQKTLVLVNGRRFAPAGTTGTVNSVDLNSIPDAIIDRIEILKDGASSIYGADAVAGVVNIITRTDLEGGVAGFSTNIPQQTDGESFEIDLAWGQVFERGHFNIAFNYSQRDSLRTSDRDWSDCEYSIRVNENTGARTDIDPVTGRPYCWEVSSRPSGGAVVTPFGPYGWVRFDPTRVGANADPDLFGLEYFTDDELPDSRFTPTSRVPGSPNILPGDQRSNEVAMIIPTQRNYAITSFGAYDIDAFGGAELFYEAFVNRSERVVNSGWGQFFYTGSTGDDIDSDGFADGYGMPWSNPLSPFGVFGPVFGNAVPLAPAYELNPNNHVNVTVMNFTAGARGDIFGDWEYETYVQYGRSDGEQRFESFLHNESGRALDAVFDGNGDVVCRSVLDGTDPNCVPLDAFSERFMFRGEMTPEERAYLVREVGTETTYEQYSFSGFITGDLFQLPAGPLATVFGVEYRNMRINDNPSDEVQNNNLLNITTAGQTKGRDSVAELFTEVEAPLIVNQPFFRDLTLNVSARYTDYESFGADTTYRLGLNWQIFDWFKVRSTFGTSFRAPALYEQFLADQIGFGDLLDDPCFNYGALEPTSPVYINCAAEGLPDDWGSQGGPGYDILVGGADDIMAETSEAFTFGVVWQPSFIDLNVAIDYYTIDVMDEIIEPSAPGILGQCYSEVNFTSPFCARVAPRDQFGYLTEVDSSFININNQLREGIDLNLVYNHEFDWGTISFDSEIAYLMDASSELLGSRSEFQGEWAFPEWAGSFDVRADWRDLTFFYNVDWIGETSQVGTSALATSRRILSTDNYFLHTASLRYQGPSWELIGGVRNLMNEDPPLVSDGASGASANLIFNTIPGAGYDLYGRTFFAGISFEF